LRKNLLIVGGLVAAILLIDQIVKIYIKTHFNYGEVVNVFGDWFRLYYVENPGMAFGTTFGSGIWGKLGLSIFRIIALIAIAIYWKKQSERGARRELLIAIGFVFAGAAGNLIDSMLYDFIFPFEGGNNPANWLEKGDGTSYLRQPGFLLGNVVDMFQFQATWPQWVPWIGGNEVFPAIWNVADTSITIGILMILFRQRAYYKKQPGKTVIRFDKPEENKGLGGEEIVREEGDVRL
jgi:signal peptidase II